MGYHAFSDSSMIFSAISLYIISSRTYAGHSRAPEAQFCTVRYGIPNQSENCLIIHTKTVPKKDKKSAQACTRADSHYSLLIFTAYVFPPSVRTPSMTSESCAAVSEAVSTDSVLYPFLPAALMTVG